ncbi:MAG: glycosyltransferase [Candidatus Coproplasma sp.]
MKKLSVIIVSYQNVQILRDCLDSINKFNDIGEDLEVIVSDNSDDMELYNTISKEYCWVKVIKNENKGFGAGNNRGYEISSGKYLLFLNPDTILVESIFGFAIEQFEKNLDLALFGVQLIDRNGNKNSSFFMIDKYGISSTLLMKMYRSSGKYIDGKMFISGANLFVRRESFEQAGRFDENIFMYKEEADLIKRIKLYSEAKRTTFFKDKRIIHLEGGTQGGNVQSLSQLERMWDTDLYYAKKWDQNIKKIYIKRKQYQRFKYFIFRVMFKKNRAQDVKRIIDYYNEKLKLIKTS